MLFMHGAWDSTLIGTRGIGFSIHLDAISGVMLLLVSFIGWVVVRYTATYLDGEPRQGAFTGWLSLTLAAVLLLVLSDNLVQLVLAWIATSLFLHRLLLFYPERIAARRAAAKKFVTARIGDVALIAGATLLTFAYGTAEMAPILRAARAGYGGDLAIAAAGFLAVAALLKSAQFPMHGWLTEVMEAPTPVSALLHAGVINAGGFLLIRFADVMVLAPSVLDGLVLIGGFTALFAGLVMLTQPAVKTSLAWSTVAQMGFMILECGLALFPLALLHIVAHSLYKAHSFLASGGAVELIAANRRPRSGSHSQGRCRGACLPPRAGDLRRRRVWLRVSAQVTAGHRAGRDPDLRRRLHAGTRFGRRRATRIDQAYRRLRRRHVRKLFRTPGLRDLVDLRGAAGCTVTRSIGMGANCPCGRQFRPSGRGPGDVSAVGLPPGSRWAARASLQWLLCQRGVRPAARRLATARRFLISRRQTHGACKAFFRE